jgi:hypothetical protein
MKLLSDSRFFETFVNAQRTRPVTCPLHSHRRAVRCEPITPAWSKGEGQVAVSACFAHASIQLTKTLRHCLIARKFLGNERAELCLSKR